MKEGQVCFCNYCLESAFMFEVTLLPIFFKSCWNGYDWSGFNIVKIVTETAHTSTVLNSSIPGDTIDNSSIILELRMLSFPYEQGLCSLCHLKR